ncbi:uncharacterized protein MELLADRAFT_123227 [Melampsora larici-populina 98AG31]|uniref:Secreted protein n=1 Tax=Melampsora larici-populina (strain 98AG31 / pathotype 3-4-7) TaxID=747676 RepID=F4RCQ3_MELLP|nr:uncharacterized protein MELLADRAFT_123227 [Melampsora larici-populina 98AG31]EGG09672.1 secreted protein [Melampsora larici-populina 98AG31]
MLFPRFITFALILAFAMVFNVAMAGPYPSFITSSQNVNWNQNLYAWNSQYNCPTYNQQPLFYSDNQFFYEFANIRYYVQGCNLSPNICLTYPVNTWNPLSYNGYSAWSWNNLRLRYNNGWNFL